jgi:L-ascorbate metabolism protein UlaG (beta-lactamase superfamily)
VLILTEKIFKIGGLTIEWFGHTSVGIYGDKVIYIDAFTQVLKGNERKADLIISTHGHGDHFDIDAINKLSKETTHVVIKTGCEKEKLLSKNIKELDVDETCILEGVDIKSVHAYNTKRFRSPGVPFHSEGFGMGVLLTVEGVKLYYAGDTDFIPTMHELKDEKIDVAFLPIGGTFTMDITDATEAVCAIEPKMVVPVHFNHVKGTEADQTEFKRMVDKRTQVKVVIL